MMAKPWFDPETGALLFDQYVAEMPSFRRIMEDNRVSDEEMRAQAERVVSVLRNLESSLPEASKALATEALCEIAVLHALHNTRMQAE